MFILKFVIGILLLIVVGASIYAVYVLMHFLFKKGLKSDGS